MVSMTTITCACGCRQKREVRTADVNRGWGLYINKSHKAKHKNHMKQYQHKTGTRRVRGIRPRKVADEEHYDDFYGPLTFNADGSFTLDEQDMSVQ